MERLTGWDSGNAYVLKCFENGGCEDMDTSKCNFCEHPIAVCNTLAKYEDTGLTPEEIVQRNTIAGSQIEKLLAENAQLRTERDIYQKALESIKRNSGFVGYLAKMALEGAEEVQP